LWNSIAEESYDYQNGGANNRRIQRTTVWHNQSYNETYSYDHLDRLTSASAGSIFSRSYSYDVYGNITSVLGSGGPHPSYSLSYNGNRVNGWSYDASGNLLSDGANSYSYNAVGQITSSSNGNSSYGYDGDSKRVKKTENGVTTYYIRSENLGMVLGEVNSSGTVTRSYLPGIGGAMAVSSGGSVYWLHRDIRGSGRAMTSKTGAVQWRAEYDPFGQVLSEMATVANSKKFTGYERDNNSSATGLDYSMFRYHSSYWGRFQTPDPFGGSYDLTDPQSFNRYSYVENDPANFVDPLGLYTVCFVDIFSINTSRVGPDGEIILGVLEYASVSCFDYGGGFYGNIGGLFGGGQDIFPFGFKVDLDIPKDQRTSTGSLRECGKFNITVTLSKLPRDLIDSINITRIEPSNYPSNSFRIVGDPLIRKEKDKIIFSASIQVGNIIERRNRVGFVGLRVFISQPAISSEEPDKIVLRALEVQKYQRDQRNNGLGVRDTIPGSDEKDPFKDCDKNIPKK